MCDVRGSEATMDQCGWMDGWMDGPVELDRLERAVDEYE